MQRAAAPASQSSPRPRGAGSLREAFAYVRGKPVVLRLVLAKAAGCTATGIVGLLPAFAIHRYTATDIATGLLFAARGVGAMVGPLLARRFIGDAPGARVIVWICGASSLVYCAAYTTFSFTHAFALALCLVTVAHFGGGAQWAYSTLGLHMLTDDHVRGRVMALDYGFATLCLGASAFVAGLLADTIGEVTTLHWLAVVGASCGVLWLLWSLPVVSRAWR